MLPQLLRAIWGNLTNDEIKKFSILSATFFLIIGVYWMLKSMRKGVFGHYVGIEGWVPIAKLASLVFVGLMVIFYSKLIDIFRKNVVFYIVCGFYGVGLISLSYLLANPQMVMTKEGTAPWILSWIPGNVLGWVAYLFIESFGSIMPALFWALVASTTTTSSAKRGYAMIISLGQVGTILGPLLIRSYGKFYGLPLFFGLGGLLILIVPFFIKLYTRVVPGVSEEMPPTKSKKGAGFFEGLRLLFSHRYLLGILAVATLFEIVGTIFDYQMDLLTDAIYPAKLAGGAAYASFQGLYGMTIGIVSLIFAVFGTSYFMRKFGLRFCLVTFPVIIGFSSIIILASCFIFGASTYQLLWIFFGIMVLIKCTAYTLNNPSREVLYIPTSDDIKFKTKGWIDAFGARAMKGVGSGVNVVLKTLPRLLTIGSLLSLGIVGFWIFAALGVSGRFDDLQRENKIVE